jgi:hypothetical protein
LRASWDGSGAANLIERVESCIIAAGKTGRLRRSCIVGQIEEVEIGISFTGWVQAKKT